MSELATIQKELREIKSMLRRQDRPRNWVKSLVVSELTGWDKEGLRKAREHGYIQFEKREDGLWYNLDTLHHLFIKNKTA